MAAYYNEYDFGKFLKIPHRQFLTLEAWIRDQWNVPNRADHYLMQLTAYVKSYITQKECSVESCKIPWNFSFQTDNLPTNDPNYRSEAELRTMAFLELNW